MAKFVPLALEPIAVPPVAAINHCIVFPAEVAFKFADAPAQIVEGFAITAVGAAGIGFTVTVTAVRVALTQLVITSTASA